MVLEIPILLSILLQSYNAPEFGGNDRQNGSKWLGRSTNDTSDVTIDLLIAVICRTLACIQKCDQHGLVQTIFRCSNHFQELANWTWWYRELCMIVFGIRIPVVADWSLSFLLLSLQQSIWKSLLIPLLRNSKVLLMNILFSSGKNIVKTLLAIFPRRYSIGQIFGPTHHEWWIRKTVVRLKQPWQ